MSSDITARRRFASKSRGICNTCRLRHVRCDALRPTCTPCRKSSRLCEYSLDPARIDANKLKVVIWQPNEEVPPPVPQGARMGTEESRALHYFRNVVADQLGGSFDASFWNRMALQAAQTVPPVRHALIALASLCESTYDAGLDLGSTDHADTFALRQYTKAISEIQQSLQGTCKPALEELLISNVLFIGIEMFQGHYESAIRQLSSGLYVFCDWQARERRQYNTATDNELQTHLRRIFTRLMVQQLLFPDTHLVDRRLLNPAFTPLMPSMPAVFGSVEEARDIFNDCVSSMIHGSLAPIFQGVEVGTTYARPLFQLHGRTLTDWSQCFEEFKRTKGEGLSWKEQTACILLEAQSITLSILASNMSPASEKAFDACESGFATIVALAQSVVGGYAHPPHDGSILHPSFDVELLPPLYFAATRCRHPAIRRQALALLRQIPRQEGLWHNAVLSNLAERIITIEECHCGEVESSEDVLAASRLKVVDAKIRSSARKIDVVFSRQIHDGEEGLELLHETVHY